MPDENLSPCVAVVGPANAGKTSLLHQVDEKLSSFLDPFQIIPGNPDGTGRYQFRARSLREELKHRVKGKWGSATVDHICESIQHGRRNLSLVLLDFGGLHDQRTAAGNARMLDLCSHYILVTRDNLAGAELWDSVCRERSLVRIARMRSLPLDGAEPRVLSGDPSTFEATYQVDIAPDDRRNDGAVEPLVQRLAALRRPLSRIPYVNLYRPGRWTPEMLPSVGGEREKIGLLAARTGVVVIGGGHTPAWAYLAALKCALDANPAVRIFFFDPKLPMALVEIPASHDTASEAAFQPGTLRFEWTSGAEVDVLEIEIATVDRFVSAEAAQSLLGAPEPPTMPSPNVALSGRLPLWLFGTYARWLIAAGARRLALWDATTGQFIYVWN